MDGGNCVASLVSRSWVMGREATISCQLMFLSTILSSYQRRKRTANEGSLQLFERGLDIWHLEKDSLVRNPLIVEHQSDAPDGGGKADVLDASQIVQDDLVLIAGSGHFGIPARRTGSCMWQQAVCLNRSDRQ